MKPYDYETGRTKGTGLALLAVEMNAADIEASLNDLSEKWRQEQEENFGA